nr:MAG TPA: hypothetical protein [Caudoviricetes sp.]
MLLTRRKPLSRALPLSHLKIRFMALHLSILNGISI